MEMLLSLLSLVNTSPRILDNIDDIDNASTFSFFVANYCSCLELPAVLVCKEFR